MGFYKRDSTLVMAAILAGNNVEQEYLWSCSLTGSNKEFKWAPEEPAEKESSDDNLPIKASHRLLIKSAILMPTAKKDEVTVVQIESEGYKQEKLTVPICVMKGGQDLQTYVDLLVPCPAKISLLQGEGPIHLIGTVWIMTGTRKLMMMEGMMKPLKMRKLLKWKRWRKLLRKRRSRRTKKAAKVSKGNHRAIHRKV